MGKCSQTASDGQNKIFTDFSGVMPCEHSKCSSTATKPWERELKKKKRIFMTAPIWGFEIIQTMAEKTIANQVI